MSPTLEEAMAMDKEAKKMAAEVRELHTEEEPEPLALFETMPIVEYRGSLAAGGFIKLEEELAVGTAVKITTTGYIKSVKFVKKKGKESGRRDHVVIIEADNTKITKA